MNIAIIHNGFPAGGAERISVDIAEYLAGFPGQYRVFVYCRTWNEAKMTDQISKVMTIRTCSHSLWGRYRDVLEYIRQDQIDIVLEAVNYMHGMRLIQKKTGVKVIFANHGQPFWQEHTIAVNKERKSPFLWKLYRKKRYIDGGLAKKKAIQKTRKWYDRCDIYTVLCPAYIQQTAEGLGIPPEKAHIIAIENSERAVPDICWKKDQTLLYCGRVVYDIKRVDRLLNIWKKIQHQLPDWKLQIVGDGPALKRCQDMVKTEKLERVYFEGYQTDVSSFFRKADIVCLTSQAEGWGLALTEGQANGCIPVAFNCSAGVEEILSPDGQCGFLIRPYDEERYAARLLEIAAMSEEEKMKIRKAAVEKRLAYTPDKISGKWKDLFDSLGPKQPR